MKTTRNVFQTSQQKLVLFILLAFCIHKQSFFNFTHNKFIISQFGPAALQHSTNIFIKRKPSSFSVCENKFYVSSIRSLIFHKLLFIISHFIRVFHTTLNILVRLKRKKVALILKKSCQFVQVNEKLVRVQVHVLKILLLYCSKD